MALLVTRGLSETLLPLEGEGGGVSSVNHIFEPEYHQDRYVRACTTTGSIKGSFQLGRADGLVYGPARGVQPIYADDDEDPESLQFEGMVLASGDVLDAKAANYNICALKSNCIRRGYIDYSLARSISRAYGDKKGKAIVVENDILINSTGDGTIGRVAVYNASFPALVDGHISIIRLKDADLAWYIAAFLLSELGQRQIYRYINGSSGQVEIYPQDISRIWIKPPKSAAHKRQVADGMRGAAALHLEFYQRLQAALAVV
jgi:type I restriction enzyme M protein